MKARSATLLIAMMVMLLAVAVPGDAQATDSHPGVSQAVDWLIDQQLDDGGFPGFDGESDAGATADAVVALAAAGVDFDGVGPIEYLASVLNDASATQGGTAKLAMAVHAAGGDAEDFDGVDLIELLQDRADESTGAYDEQVFIHATAMLAVLATGNEPVEGAIEFLLDRQIEDGSWAFTGDTEPGMGDTNTTALAIQALAAADGDEVAISAGIDYLLDAQLDDGSVVYAIGAEDPPMGDSNSTALALQAMIAAGVDEDYEGLVAASEALLEFQNESGALHYRADMPEDNALSTSQAIPAMLGLALPIHSAESAVIDEHDLILVAAAVAEPIDSETCDFFEITNHNLCDEFNEHWWGNGGLAIFGYPITEEFTTVDEDGNEIVVQYFERSRFELSAEAPEGEQVSVATLGAERSSGFDDDDEVNLDGDCVTIEDADHAVCGEFLDYWNEFGGLDAFGLPVGAAHDADGMVVQYFELARFEYQPGEWPERYDVLLGRLGSEFVNEVLAE